MKLVMITCLLIGATFVRADLIGTLVGTVLPYFQDATDGYNELAEAKKGFAGALNKTTNCGSSGSNKTLMNVVKGNEDVAQAVFNLSVAIRNNTDDVGQLKFKVLAGDITQITDQIENAGVALKTLASYIRTLISNIGTVSIKGVGKLVASQNASTNASRAFYAAFTQMEAPSKTILQLSSVLIGFIDALRNVSDGSQAEIYSIRAAEKRCNVSTGLPEALGSFKEIFDEIIQQLILLH